MPPEIKTRRNDSGDIGGGRLTYELCYTFEEKNSLYPPNTEVLLHREVGTMAITSFHPLGHGALPVTIAAPFLLGVRQHRHRLPPALEH